MSLCEALFLMTLAGLDLWSAAAGRRFLIDDARSRPKRRQAAALQGKDLLAACQRGAYPLSCNPAVRKLLIRLGKSLFLGSGKATTRAKRRITSRVEGTGPSHRFPTRAFGSKSVPLP